MPNPSEPTKPLDYIIRNDINDTDVFDTDKHDNNDQPNVKIGNNDMKDIDRRFFGLPLADNTNEEDKDRNNVANILLVMGGTIETV